MLMKYLVDSLQSYESGHRNVLHPIPAEPEKSFMSEHSNMQPVTAEEICELRRSVDQKLDDLVGTFQLNLGLSFGGVAPQIRNFSNVDVGPVQSVSQLWQICKAVSNPYLSNIQPGASNYDTGESDSSNDVAPPLRSSRSLPIIGVSIPDVGHEHGAWRRAITQWEQGTADMPQGLALKEWPEAWYTKGMTSVTGTKRSQQKLIADEYNRFVTPICHCRFHPHTCYVQGLDMMMQGFWLPIHLQIQSL